MSVSRPSPHVLVVEDDPLLSFAMCAILSEYGYSVITTCERVANAVGVAANVDIDLLVTDVNLAGRRNGLQGAMALREFQDVPVAFCTAATNPELLARLRAFPRSRLLAKPFKTHDFLEAIDSLLSERFCDELARVATVEPKGGSEGAQRRQF